MEELITGRVQKIATYTPEEDEEQTVNDMDLEMAGRTLSNSKENMLGNTSYDFHTEELVE